MATDFRPSASDPGWAPILADDSGSRVLWCRLSENDCRNASFLDQRLVQGGIPTRWTDWGAVLDAGGALAPRADFIFHVGHVGSTLISRLLGTAGAILALREPALLRTFAQVGIDQAALQADWSAGAFDSRLSACLGLWSRVYRPGQRTLIKATSFVSEIAPALVQQSRGAKALAVTVSPQIYLATILGGPSSRMESRAMAPARLQRLYRRVGGAPWRLADLSEGETIAMSWVTEMAALNELPGGTTLWLDFDRFLSDMRGQLRLALSHLHGTVRELDLAAMLVSPSLRRYSKAPDHPYDATVREGIVQQAIAEHGTEIARGLTWLAKGASQHRPIAAALDRYPAFQA